VAGTEELLSGFYSNPGSQIYEWSFSNSHVNNLCSAWRLRTRRWLAGLRPSALAAESAGVGNALLMLLVAFNTY